MWQINITYMLLSLIQLDPATVWLREESPGNQAFFPDEHNTRFVLNDDVGILINVVCQFFAHRARHPWYMYDIVVWPSYGRRMMTGLLASEGI